HIDVTPGRPEYRPGERARLQLRLSGRDGKPVPGAISLAAVDEAVFSVLDHKPGMELSFFTLEQELLKPVLAAYAWTPGALPEVPAERRVRFEQALFARAARDDEADHEASSRKPLRGIGNSPRALDVVKRRAGEPLRDTAGVHTLSATSFPAKLQAINLEKARGITFVRELSAGAALLGFAYVLVLAWRRFWFWILAGFGILALSALLLPAVQQAKLARASAQPDATDARFNSAHGAKSEEEAGPDLGAATSENIPPRLRQWFPETLLWRPELITDDNGEVSIDVDLADSITTWRVSASAVSAQGDLGAAQSSVRVFQSFFVDVNLPVALTRGDAVTVPVIVYNYLDRPQTVELNLENGAAFELTGLAQQTVELAAGEVKSVGYRLRAQRVGKQTLRVAARAEGIADAVERTVEIVSDGQKTEQVASGNLTETARIPVEIPEQTIDGSVKATLKIYPSNFSQLVEGLEGVFQRPSGCFEQTSSTTYPNVLALDYLIRTKKSVPDVEARARQYIHLGYQRLLTFEIAGGGFEWFGQPPANRVLSAYGLMEFVDMARVHDVDRSVIERTRGWLLPQQKSDGTWEPEGHLLHDDPTVGAGNMARLAATAYIAWAVFGGDSSDRESIPARKTLDYLVLQDPAAIDDPYVLALVASGIAAIDRSPGAAAALLRRLDSRKQSTADGKRVWWEGNATGHTLFYGGGMTRRIETTALASLALLHSTGNHAATVRGALAWLMEQKDARGTWHSTQATVLALKALLAATERPLGEAVERQIELAIDGQALPPIVIPGDQADVMQQIDLSSKLGIGNHEVVIRDRRGGSMGYQLTVSHYTPGEPASAAPESLSVTLQYEKTDLRIGESILATAVVRNNSPSPVAMVLVDLPIPSGFAADAAGFAQLVVDRRIEKYQITPRRVIVYLRSLEPGQSLTIPYKLKGTISVEVTSGAAVAWEYYQPENTARSPVARLIVSE
ncbi:MAG TPA: alpha-2-macroglobulin family protein, partial [Planctomycetaceae bacterium]